MVIEGRDITFIKSVLQDCIKVIDELYDDTEEEYYMNLIVDIEEALGKMR